MSKTLESFLEKLVWPLFTTILTPSLILLGSKIQSGNWLVWAQHVPLWAYAAFFILIILWIFVVFVVRRIHRLKHLNTPGRSMFISIPMHGFANVGTLNHCDVVWIIQAPAPAPWEVFPRNNFESNQLSIKTPPHCPSCDTELEEETKFFGGYKWSCVRCGFFKTHSNKFYRESLRAEKIAKSIWNEQS